MPTPPRFQTAIHAAAPRHLRRIEAYSPKLGRRLQCFGGPAFGQWLCLEADPLVTAFCERPAFLTEGPNKRLVDFWVRREGSETLVVLDEELQATPVIIGGAEIPVCPVRATELAAARVWIQNWERMLPCIVNCREWISRTLLQSVARFVSEPMSLGRIEREFNAVDLSLARAAVFTLLHRGLLQAPHLWTEPLSRITLFAPVGSPT